MATGISYIMYKSSLIKKSIYKSMRKYVKCSLALQQALASYLGQSIQLIHIISSLSTSSRVSQDYEH